VVTKLLKNPAYLGEAVLHRYERDRQTGQVIVREGLARRPENHVALLRPDHNARGFRTYICKGAHGMGRCAAPA